MDFFNKAAAQVNDLFKSMSPGARITAGLLLAAIVISLVYLFRNQVNGADDYLLGGRPFSSDELPAMIAAFDKAGLSGHELEGNRIRVPVGQEAAYVGALADGGALPSDFQSIMDKGAAAGASPLLDKTQREEIMKAAKERTLASFIREMPGIEQAGVLYDTQKGSRFNQPPLITASVSVKPTGSQPLDRARVPMIRHLVAAAIAGLSAKNVTIIDLNGGHYPGGGDDGDGGDHPYVAAMQQFKKEYESQIQNVLSFVPGAMVSVNVELDKELRHSEEKVQVDPKSVAVMKTEDTTTKSVDGPANGGRPGLPAQAANANTAAQVTAASSAPHTDEEVSSTREQNVVGSNRTTIEQVTLTPKRVSVAVVVPSSYYERVWHDKHPTPAGQEKVAPPEAELKQIEQEQTATIKNLVGKVIPNFDATDPASLVSVSTLPHAAEPDLPGPGVAGEAITWFSRYWSTFGLGGLALFSLIMLRSMVRSVPAEQVAPTAAPSAAVSTSSNEEEDQAEEAGGTAPAHRLKRRGLKGPSLRDELAEIVREDPDAAANILKTWIGSTN